MRKLLSHECWVSAMSWESLGTSGLRYPLIQGTSHCEIRLVGYGQPSFALVKQNGH